MGEVAQFLGEVVLVEHVGTGLHPALPFQPFLLLLQANQLPLSLLVDRPVFHRPLPRLRPFFELLLQDQLNQKSTW